MLLDIVNSVVPLTLPFLAGGILWIANKAFGVSKSEAARKTLTAALERSVAAMTRDYRTAVTAQGAAEVGIVPDTEGVVSYIKRQTPDALKTLGMSDNQLSGMIDAEFNKLIAKG